MEVSGWISCTNSGSGDVVWINVSKIVAVSPKFGRAEHGSEIAAVSHVYSVAEGVEEIMTRIAARESKP